MTIDKPKIIQVASVVLLVLFFAIPIIIFYITTTTKPVSKPSVTIPTPTPQMFPREQLGQKRVIRTMTQGAIYLWMYGKVKTIEQVDANGILATVILDGDPLQNNLHILLATDEGMYKIYWYDSEFGGSYKLQLVDEKTARALLTDSTKLQYRISYPREFLSDEDKKNMAILEGPNGGNWSALSKTSILKSDILGVIKTQQ